VEVADRSLRLSELGERICILGPSNSGKSTLADAIGRKRGSKVVHLDQLHHQPNTDWKMRPAHEFLTLHNEAIASDQWVIDGNYSKLFPQRFERATGIILLDISTAASLFRYIRRTVFPAGRIGGLEGGQDSLNLAMFHHIAVVTPGNRKRYANVYRQLHLSKVYLPSIRAIKARYKGWDLK
jgi:hypothetical protein